MATQKLTLGDLTQRLSTIPLSRRQAILFALDMNLPISHVEELTWRGVSDLKLTPLAKRILLSVPRHIRLNYVFWEDLPNHITAPLFGLARDALKVSNRLGFQELRDQYQNILIIDQFADLEDMITTMIDIRQASLHLTSLQ